MNETEICALVEQSARVRVSFLSGGVYTEGRVIAAHLHPSIVVLQDDGERVTVSSRLPIEVLQTDGAS